MNRIQKCCVYALVASFVFYSSCASAPDSAHSSTSQSVSTSEKPYIDSGKPDSGKDAINKPNSSEKGTVTSSAISSGFGTPLAIPERAQLKKNDLDSTVLGYIEKGSPDSIRKAVALVNTDPRGMTDQNRVALAVSGELMKIVYPFEEDRKSVV